MLGGHTGFPPCTILGFFFTKFFNPLLNQHWCVTQHSDSGDQGLWEQPQWNKST